MRWVPPYGIAVVTGRSMEPTLRAGDRLLAAYGGRPRPGDLVLVRLPGRPLAVKRATRREPGGWWVERDNPDEGVDSWVVGTLADEDVLGVVVVRLSRLAGAARPAAATAGALAGALAAAGVMRAARRAGGAAAADPTRRRTRCRRRRWRTGRTA